MTDVCFCYMCPRVTLVDPWVINVTKQCFLNNVVKFKMAAKIQDGRQNGRQNPKWPPKSYDLIIPISDPFLCLLLLKNDLMD